MNGVDTNKYGPWALVTGASSGIGEEFARQLAAGGLNVVLVARRKQVLDALAQELESKHHVQARAVPVDLGEPDAVSTIAEATADLEIGLLVSDAAMVTGGALGKTPVADEVQLIQVNIVAALQLAHHYAPRMGQRGKGGIIFVASVAGYASVPYLANYVASKAYLISFGEALHGELKKKGVDVTVLCPATVETKNAEERARLKKEKGMDLGALGTGMNVTPVVSAALKALGKKPAVVPGVTNKITVFVFKHFLTRRVTTRIFGLMTQKTFAKELIS